LPKPGNANWALKAAAWPPLQSSISCSSRPFYTAKKGSSSTDTKPRHTTSAPSQTSTKDLSKTRIWPFTSRMGRPPPPFRTTSSCPPAFYNCQRAQRTAATAQPRMISIANRLCGLTRSPSRTLHPPFRHTSRRLTSLCREQTIAVMHQLHSCHLPNSNQTTSSTTTAPAHKPPPQIILQIQLPTAPAPCIYPRCGFGQTPAGQADLPRRSGRRRPAPRLSTIVNVRREPQPAPSPKGSRLQTLYVVKPARPAGRFSRRSSDFAAVDLTSP